MRLTNVSGLVTLYYDGTELYNEEYEHELWYDLRTPNDLEHESELKTLSKECRKYWEDRQSWQQIIVAEGVKEIREWTFNMCLNIERVIFGNTVTSLKMGAFNRCKRLKFIKWSINTKFLGDSVFADCNLSSVYIPLQCKEVCDDAFNGNENLSIFVVPQETKLGSNVIGGTKLIRKCPINTHHTCTFFRRVYNQHHTHQMEKVNAWIKGINCEEKYKLHRACSSIQPLNEVIFDIIQEKGIHAIHLQNDAGLTALEYLEDNPYTELTEKQILYNYIESLDTAKNNTQENFIDGKSNEVMNDVQNDLNESHVIKSLEERILSLELELSKQTVEIAHKNEELLEHKKKIKKYSIENSNENSSLFRTASSSAASVTVANSVQKTTYGLVQVPPGTLGVRLFKDERGVCVHSKLWEETELCINDIIICIGKRQIKDIDDVMVALQDSMDTTRFICVKRVVQTGDFGNNVDGSEAQSCTANCSSTANDAKSQSVPTASLPTQRHLSETAPSKRQSFTDVSNISNETISIQESPVDNRRHSKRLRTTYTAVAIKREDIVDGVVKCPVCQKPIFTSDKGCNIITCRHHSPHFVYFCIHCKKVNENGVEYRTCSCEYRNTRETRAEAQRRRNNEARSNPIEID